MKSTRRRQTGLRRVRNVFTCFIALAFVLQLVPSTGLKAMAEEVGATAQTAGSDQTAAQAEALPASGNVTTMTATAPELPVTEAPLAVQSVDLGEMMVRNSVQGDNAQADASCKFVLEDADGTGVAGVSYTIYGSSTNTSQGTTGADGSFTLKNGEAADFLLDSASYKVAEIDAQGAYSTTWANADPTGEHYGGGTVTASAPVSCPIVVPCGYASSISFFNNTGVNFSIDLEKYVKNTLGKDVTLGTDPSFDFSITGTATGTDGVAIDCPLPASSSTSLSSSTSVPAGYGAAAATGSFGVLTFSQPGTYTYTITEAEPAGGNWANDADHGSSSRVLTVVVAADHITSASVISSAVWDNLSGANDTVTTSSATASFYNIYTPTPATFAGTVINKTVEGSGFGTQTFGFTITPQDGAPEPTSTTGTATFTEAGTQSIDFGTFTFTEPGTYSYTVKEDTPNPYPDGWQLDTAEKDFTVTVTAGDDGKLAVSSTPATITNTYTKTTSSANPTKTSGKTPFTGDETPMDTMAILVLSAGALLLVSGAIKKRRDRRSQG